MPDRKAFPLRIDRAVLDAVQRWANDDLRSVNGQIEYLLRDALRRAGRVRASKPNTARDVARDVSADVSPDDAPNVSAEE